MMTPITLTGRIKERMNPVHPEKTKERAEKRPITMHVKIKERVIPLP